MFNPFPVLAACLLLLAGCGQKGPLYLPGDPSEMQMEIPEIGPGSLPGGEATDGEPDEPADDEAENDASNNQPDDGSN